VHYFDGTLFSRLLHRGPAAYAIATERYIRDSNDDQIVEEPVSPTRSISRLDDIAARRDATHPAVRHGSDAFGRAGAAPFTLHRQRRCGVGARCASSHAGRGGRVARAEIPVPCARRSCGTLRWTVEARRALRRSIDLAGGAALEDDPVGSLMWLRSTRRSTAKTRSTDAP
jgi:hypothetical protein